VGALFEPPGESFRGFGYVVTQKDTRTHEAGKVKLTAGHAVLASTLTRESADFAYAALHLGDHNVSAGVTEYPGDAEYQVRAAELEAAFGMVDTPRIIRLIDRHFGEATHSVASLFRDLQRTVLKRLLRPGLTEIIDLYYRVHQQNLPLVQFLRHLNVPLPLPMQATAEVLFNTDLRWALKDDDPDFEQVRDLVRDARAWGTRLDTQTLGFRFKRVLRRAAERWRDQPAQAELMNLLAAAVDLAREMPFEPDLWVPQNVYFDLAAAVFPERLLATRRRDAAAREWVTAFVALGEKLGINVDALKKQVG
jgi:hypothetical protein